LTLADYTEERDIGILTTGVPDPHEARIVVHGRLVISATARREERGADKPCAYGRGPDHEAGVGEGAGVVKTSMNGSRRRRKAGRVGQHGM
jgi:hypothetical protein